MSFVQRLAFASRRNRAGYRIHIGPDGIPISDYGYIDGRLVGRQYSIVAVADRGLDYWNRFVREVGEKPALLCYDWSRFPVQRRCRPLTSDDGRTMFLNCADWMCERVCPRGGYVVWEYAYPSFYGTTAGWKSAHAQAEGIQLLLRAHAATKDDRYLQVAMQALPAFEVPFEDGGLRLTTGRDAWWYLKFADANAMRRPRVLNGMMFALLGIHEVCERGDAFAVDLFHRGTNALTAFLHRFDGGNWSYYDDAGKPASLHYHSIHIEQLHRLYDCTRETALRMYAMRFSAYLTMQDSGAGSLHKDIQAGGGGLKSTKHG